MGETWRVLKLLMYKNMIVRRKNWKLMLFVEVMIPLILILIGQIVRTLMTDGPTRIDQNTYHDINPMEHECAYGSQLRYAPKNDLTERIMNRTGQCMSMKDEQLIGSESESHMVNEIKTLQDEHPYGTFLGIVFENVDSLSLPKKFRYKFRTSAKLPAELYEKVENGDAATYAFGGYFTLTQMCLDRAYIEEATPSSNINITMSTQQMPYPPFVLADPQTILGGQFIGELARLAFLVVMCVEVKFPINEKYIGINVLMSVNGVKNVQNLLSWLMSGAMFSVVYLGPIVIMLRYFLPPILLPYLAYSNGFIVWIVLTIHVCHIMAFAMHTTAYLWRPARAIFVAFIIMTLMDVITRFLTDAKYVRLFIYLGIFSPNFMLNLIFHEINFYENKMIGVGWNNLFTPGDTASPRESSLGGLIVFSILGILIHFLLAVYVYAVRPGKYGVARHPLYFLQGRKKVLHDGDVALLDYNREDRKEFERVPEGTLTPGIQIRGLKKTYATDLFRRKAVQALRGIDVDFYKGQITALLGHNGAGKTTMISVLSGLTGSTEGTVFIDGKNVQHDLESVQQNLGLCPQENIVFPDLSVFEQVMFFGMLKASDKTKDELTEEVEILLEKVNLTEKKNSLAEKLSGGQKRRMCLAMAVIGDASVLILDEPTSGMDAESKREVWDMILKLRGETTILISSHDMEEADILGDRIAIIHSGKMRCYGTSMFLKKLYSDRQVEVTLSTEPSCEPQSVIDEIGLSAQLLSVDDGKVVLAIPFADNLPEALDTLEQRKSELGITGLSVSLITLEQVFIRVTKEHDVGTNFLNEAARSFEKLTGFRYFVQTVLAFFIKKFTYTRKNPWTLIVCMFWPAISVILMILQHSSEPDIRRSSLSLDAYTDTRSIAYAEQKIYGEKYLTSAEGFGGAATYIGPNSSLTNVLLASAVADLNAYRTQFIVSGEFNITGGNIVANGLYSGTALLGVPATVNMLTNTIVKALTGDDEYSISIWAEELPKPYRSFEMPATNSFVLTLALIVFLGPAVAQYVTQPLQENSSGVKQLQAMTGASSLAYWGSTYLFDLLQYTLSMVLLIVAFVIVDASYGTQFYHGTEIMIFFLVLFLFGASVLPLVYVFSFWKKSASTSITVLSIAPVIVPFADLLFLSVVSTVNNKAYDVFRDIQSRIFLVVPYTSIFYGHGSFFDTVLVNSRCRRMPNRLIEVSCSANSDYSNECCKMKCWDGVCKNPASYFVPNDTFTSLPESLIWMAGSAVLFFGIIYVLEKKMFAKLCARLRRAPSNIGAESTDELVEEEARKVTVDLAKMLLNKNNSDHPRNENIFYVSELSKSYGSLNVVKGISFRVKQGECFGLLGVNGAGKSTTFRMLTGEELPNSGTMYLNEYSLNTERKNYLAAMGYCPQQNAILDSLDSWDHLYLFARLRGIPNREVKETVEKWIHKLNLTACASQPSGTYSGGNKRRLNIAMALMGNPLLVLMDEPTTGVDPAARRSLWNTLKMCQQGGQSIILTSHSMEECEALCNRLVIMIKGRLVCVGASQELRQRFGAGYNIHVKLNPGCQRSDVEKIKNRIDATLVCKLTDENKGFIGFHVTDRQATWTKMYTMMNELKADYDCIEDFAVLSSTLEQLFIQFARARGDTGDTAPANAVTKRRWWHKKTQDSAV